MSADLIQAMAACSTCPKMCRHVCPTAIVSGRESRTPTAKSTYGLLWERGQLELDDDVRQAFYDCCHCGLCAEHCEVPGVDLVAETRHLRAKLVQTDQALPAVAAWAAAYEATGWPPGTPVDVFGRYARQSAQPRTLILIGEAARHGESLVQAALAVANARGEAVATLGEAEISSGDPALALGYPELAQRLGQALVARLNEGSWERILVLDAAEAVLMQLDWPGMGIVLNKTVISWPAWLAESPSTVSTTSERVAYHDPCSLARGLGDVDSPRTLIQAAGATLVEPVWSGRESRCCGAGGGLPVSNPDMAAAVAKERASHFQDLGVDRVLTACGTCAAHLAGALGPELPVEDIGAWLVRQLDVGARC